MKCTCCGKKMEQLLTSFYCPSCKRTMINPINTVEDDKNEVLELIGEIDFIDIDSKGYVIIRTVYQHTNNGHSRYRIQTHADYFRNVSIQAPQTLEYLISLRNRKLYRYKAKTRMFEYVIV